MSDDTYSTNDDQAPGRSFRQTGRWGRRRALFAGGAAVVLLGGGTAVAAGTGMIGGSAQPESVLPGDAMFFAKLDLDPGVAQKVGAFRLFDKLPEAKQALGENDPKKSLFELAKKSDKDLANVDYARDVEPWLGDRAGFALVASQDSKDPVPVLALAVKDEDKAREGVARLSAATSSAAAKARSTASTAEAAAGLGSNTGSKKDDTSTPIFKDGYVLLTDKNDESRLQQSLNGSTLADNETFSGDMSTVGETGVASGWMDNAKVFALARKDQAARSDPSQEAMLGQMSGTSGRSAFALRFAPDHLELAQVGRGVQKGVNSPALQGIKDLPADTAGFLSFTGGSDYVKQWWPMVDKIAGQNDPSFDENLQKIQQQTGLTFPDDLQTLLGSQFDAVVAKQDFTKMQGNPKLGVRTWTDTAKAQSILDKVRDLMQQSGQQFPVVTQTHGGHLDLGLDDSYTTTLAGGGTLGSNPGFQAVLPDIDQSSGALFVDLDAIESQYLGSVPADQRDLVQSLQAVGMSTGPVVNGEQHSTMRISVN